MECAQTIVIEFMYEGEHHKSTRTNTAPEMLHKLLQSKDYIANLKKDYEAAGAEVLSVYVLESVQVNVDNMTPIKTNKGKCYVQPLMTFGKIISAAALVGLINVWWISKELSEHHISVTNMLGVFGGGGG